MGGCGWGRGGGAVARLEAGPRPPGRGLGTSCPPHISPAGVNKQLLLFTFMNNTFSGECAPGVLLECFGFKSFP